jgi:hypothetical protein
MKITMQKVVSRWILFWMVFITISLSIIKLKRDGNETIENGDGNQDKEDLFYKVGPNVNLIIMGIKIDTYGKYFIVVSYCFVNSMSRTLCNNVLHSWLINQVQDESKDKKMIPKSFAYEVTITTTIYFWFDWFIYMNILLSQIDMILIEIMADLVMSLMTTTYYLHKGENRDSETLPLFNK